jgi:hypothetical protein
MGARVNDCQVDSGAATKSDGGTENINARLLRLLHRAQDRLDGPGNKKDVAKIGSAFTNSSTT